ncbi:MAG: AAA family ATPase, partial [Caldilineaceae bacterium]|nr:AAA family ATPase [Caldilineaceae bacterium]
TVKWYVKQIYHKLQVRRRTEAAIVARSLGLVEQTLNPVAVPATPNISDDEPFVGRSSELERLDQFLQTTLAGLPQIAFVTGEAGSGKSALVQTFLRHAQRKHPRLIAVSGYCNAFTGIGDPYFPFYEILTLLTGNVQIPRQMGTLDPTQVERLTTLLPETVTTVVEHGPALLTTILDGQSLLTRLEQTHTVSRSWIDRMKTVLAQDVSAMPPGTVTQQRLFVEMANVLQRLAHQQPLLLVLDDLQWADMGSLNLLFHLSRELVDVPILIIGIYRTSDVAVGRNGERHPLLAVVHELQRRFGEQRIALEETGTPVFVNALLDTLPNRFTPEFRREFYEHTHGHALFSVEMLRSLQERGNLVRNAEGQWEEGLSLNWEVLPPKVEAVIAERIGRLPSPLLEILTVASVEGETFTAEVVAQVLGMDERIIVRHLEAELSRGHHLVHPQETRRFKERRISQYRFRHHLFQRYLYTRLNETQRVYLHEDVGCALETFYAGDNMVITAITGALGRHFREAENYRKAIYYLQLAGDRAMALSAHDEAIGYFAEALALLNRSPHGSQRDQQELTLQLRLAAQLIIVRGHSSPEVEQVYAHTRKLSLRMDNPHTPEHLSMLYMLWAYYLIRGQMPATRELAERIAQLGKCVTDNNFHLTAHWALGVTALCCGELSNARSHLEQLIRLALPEEVGDLAHMRALDPKAAGLFWLARTLWNLGYPDQARARGEEAIAHARTLEHPHTLVIALSNSAWVYLLCGQWETARQLTAEAIDLCVRYGMPQLQGLATCLSGNALIVSGDTTNGVAELNHGHAMHKETGSHLSDPYFLATKAVAYSSAGDPTKGLRLITEAMNIAQQNGEHLWDAELCRIKGELLLQQSTENADLGNDVETQAKLSFLQAVKIAQQQQARSFELGATISLARL